MIKKFVGKSYEGKNTNFYDTRIPRKASQCICLSVTLADFLKKQVKNYSQVLLEEFKYAVKKKR